MRVNNPSRNNPCGCEHVDHEDHEWSPNLGRVPKPRTAHRYGKVEADGGWAQWVGHVCMECAATHMKDYMVIGHCCGEGDCWRGRVEMESVEMERRQLVRDGRKASGQTFEFALRRQNHT
jgi:hypothetical protein